MTLKWTRRITVDGTCLMMYSTTTKTVSPEMIAEIDKKYGSGSYRGTGGVSNSTHDGMQLTKLYPRSQSEVREFVRYLAGPGLVSPHPEQWMIGLYCPTIKGKTYAVAVMVNYSQH